jgi:hypothetical protein
MKSKLISKIAKVCHQAEKSFAESLGDNSMVNWEESSLKIKEDTESKVISVINKENVLAEDLHIQWLDERIEEGWSYGSSIDYKKKTHPNMLPFSELEEYERKKYFLFVSIVKSLFNYD